MPIITRKSVLIMCCLFVSTAFFSACLDTELIDSGTSETENIPEDIQSDNGSGDSDDSNSDSGTGTVQDDVAQTSCQAGSSDTPWGTSCPVVRAQCVSGSWNSPGDTGENGAPLRLQSDHFAVYWRDGTDITNEKAQAALDTLEHVWEVYFGETVRFQEPYCDSSIKWKATIHFDNDYPLWGGTWFRDGNLYMGMWVGPGVASDGWGLAHEFAHGVQMLTPAFEECGGVACWIYESHANFMAHQVYPNNLHCSEMLANAPHLHYGNTRNRYCNWQFFEYLKDRFCIDMVNAMWTSTAAVGQRDPWQKLMASLNWDIETLNDAFGEWAMHNVIWDYQSPDGTNKGSLFRQSYAALNSDPGNHTERRLRLTQLESMDDNWQQNKRFTSPYHWAPQRWGYNTIRLYPETNASEVIVNFQGVEQADADSGWRWGIVATNNEMTEARYSEVQSGTEGELRFCFTEGEQLYLVVLAAPSSYQKIVWSQPSDGTAYPEIYRYPYMVEFDGAWPSGFQGGQRDACPAGTVRHSNGGGCAPQGTSTSVYVGPYAKVLSGNVSGSARIEDHATIVNGQVTGGTVGALSLIGVSANSSHWNGGSFNVSDNAVVKTTFYPLGWFNTSASASGTAEVIGDVEFWSSNKSSNSFYGLVSDEWSGVTYINDVTIEPPYVWR